MKNNYCIRPDYVHRENEVFLDTSTRTDEFQDKVYSYASKVAKDNDLLTVADVGCGSGYKLLKYFLDKITVGYDLKETIEVVKKKHPLRKWLVSNFNKKPSGFDLVICADVIEHVLKPDDLIHWILSMNASHIVISTPNRDALVSGLKRCPTGPPHNPHHIREWSFSEFECYMEKYFNINNHFTIDKEYCQVIHCTPK